jgi:hypothetical protein
VQLDKRSDDAPMWRRNASLRRELATDGVALPARTIRHPSDDRNAAGFQLIVSLRSSNARKYPSALSFQSFGDITPSSWDNLVIGAMSLGTPTA